MNGLKSVGVDLQKFQDNYCTAIFISRRIYYISLDDIDPEFGKEKATEIMRRYAYVAVQLEDVCTELEDNAVKSILEMNDTMSDDALELVKHSGSIGIDLSLFNENNRLSMEKALTEDKEIDHILKSFETMGKTGQKPYASTFLNPLMKKLKYDARSPPIMDENKTVTVRVGIHVQSVSNFELTTMDFDMDMWLRMAWRDPRLAHGLNGPILITEESYLKRLWRPDAVFVNSMESFFHRVTYLNFYIFVFPEGEVFFEARVYLKPKSQLVLCKYPHDYQTLILRISSIAMTDDTVRFQWFPIKRDAIRVNRNIQLPELHITAYESTTCDARRKTGNYTCLEARFHLKRSIGYHMAQTYVPTATCVVFSWISVWLPEEFVEGRIFVALTVFLTLSAESNAAKDTLPKVSYIKAIDIWFGFTASFVFSTMLQALIVIRLENMSKEKRKLVEKDSASLGVDKTVRLLIESKRLHKLSRWLDEFFKVMYPVIFLIFLFIYAFVVIQGEPTCV
ncbi:unnamed protein product [Bursaphelenchus okinawaensis]|uniref:Neur_chan_LBD domain-containing protein n=1 Tax=Bursaphelenchus okinawaensis TaxID=465554 RepID=A0A811K4I4_9BILA|nr:unnamed protein product [Bursaphelenchus okinawaensis]CAG9091257.1 unnamed protein product [Bursaphelenchus okinawaensis]